MEHKDPQQWAEWRGMRLEADMKWRAATPAAQGEPKVPDPSQGVDVAHGEIRVGGACHE